MRISIALYDSVACIYYLSAKHTQRPESFFLLFLVRFVFIFLSFFLFIFSRTHTDTSIRRTAYSDERERWRLCPLSIYRVVRIRFTHAYTYAYVVRPTNQLTKNIQIHIDSSRFAFCKIHIYTQLTHSHRMNMRATVPLRCHCMH